jgi:NCAIR mutase (PurE)-related protein
VSILDLERLLGEVAEGAVSPVAALARLRRFPVDDLQFAQVDHLRPVTQGHAEVVMAQGKTPDQVAAICHSLAEAQGAFLVTRAEPAVQEAVLRRFPQAVVNELGRTVALAHDPPRPPTGRGTVLVLTAGTADLPVAEEAAVTARALGNRVARLNDVGVAGIHRILRKAGELNNASVAIVVAGMDGALASVVGGMVRIPVIAVPTSVGYGASFGGLAALLAMLNSCASGVVVVNIDNGFGAAAAASRINHLP